MFYIVQSTAISSVMTFSVLAQNRVDECLLLMTGANFPCDNSEIFFKFNLLKLAVLVYVEFSAVCSKLFTKAVSLFWLQGIFNLKRVIVQNIQNSSFF